MILMRAALHSMDIRRIGRRHVFPACVEATWLVARNLSDGGELGAEVLGSCLHAKARLRLG